MFCCFVIIITIIIFQNNFLELKSKTTEQANCKYWQLPGGERERERPFELGAEITNGRWIQEGGLEGK